MKPALIVVDIQNVWLDSSPGLKQGIEKRAKTINDAIGWFRRNNRPIIVVYHEEPEKGLVPGVKPFEFSDMIEIKRTDTKVVKRHPDSFGGTGLERVVKQKGCDTIVIAGISAVWCALATYFGAMNHGIDPYFLKGGVSADREEHTRLAEEICDSITVDKLEEAVRGS